jgi:hypothetical protein
VIFKQYVATNKKLAMYRGNTQGPPKDTPQMRQWSQFMSIYKQSPLLTLTLLEKSPLEAWIMRIDQLINEGYGATTREERQQMEASMLIRGNIPDKLMPAVSAIFDSLESLQKFYDPGQLYRFDTTWLGIGAAAASEKGKRKKTYDVLKKTELVPGTPLKLCPRCGSVSEEYETAESSPFWMSSSLRNCICGVLWAVADGDGSRVKRE